MARAARRLMFRVCRWARVDTGEYGELIEVANGVSATASIRWFYRQSSVPTRYVRYMGALLSVCLGVGSMLQLGQNGALSRHLGHYLPASVVSYTGGVAILAVWQLLWRWQLGPNPKEEYRQGRPRRPIGALLWWEASGGAIGCCTLVSSVAASPHLSYTVMATSGSVGQMLSSLLADHTGFMGVPVRRLSVRRLLGAALVLAGCVGASIDMADASVTTSLSPVARVALALIYVLARAGQPIQSCLNYRLAAYLPAPAGPMAGAISFTVGMLTVYAGCVAMFARHPERLRQTMVALRPPQSASIRWWMLAGGINGAMHTSSTVYLSQELGTTGKRTTALSIRVNAATSTCFCLDLLPLHGAFRQCSSTC